MRWGVLARISSAQPARCAYPKQTKLSMKRKCTCQLPANTAVFKLQSSSSETTSTTANQNHSSASSAIRSFLYHRSTSICKSVDPRLSSAKTVASSSRRWKRRFTSLKGSVMFTKSQNGKRCRGRLTKKWRSSSSRG